MDAYPSRHGYQHVGRVSATGSDVETLASGDWVFFGKYVGHRAWHIRDVVQQTDPHDNESHLTFRLPADAEHDVCALFGVAGVATRGVRRFRVQPGQRVWVVGAGLIGQFAAQVAQGFGADVTLTDLSSERLDRARQAGVRRTNSVADANTCAPTEVRDLGPFDCIIDACGLPSILLDIHEAGVLAHGGIAGCLAMHRHTEFDWSMLHSREASIEVSNHFSLDDLRVVMQFYQSGHIQIEPLIAHRVAIAEAPEMYALLRDEPGRQLGVIFDWGRGRG